MILINSYGLIFLLSFVTPGVQVEDNIHTSRVGCSRQSFASFDELYRGFLCVGGAGLCELPLLVTRLQIVSAGGSELPGTFYLWLIKNLLLLSLLLFMVLWHKLGRRFNSLVTLPVLDNPPRGRFLPEKRDVYIAKKKVRFRDPIDDVSHV